MGSGASKIVQQSIEEGDRKFAVGDYAGAITEFDRIILAQTRSSSSYYKRGLAKNALGRGEEAIKDFDQAIKLTPKFAEAFYQRGLFYFSRSLWEKAIVNLEAVIRFDPYCTEAFKLCADAKVKKSLFAEAIVNYNQVLSLDPNHREALKERAQAKAKLGCWLEALLDLDEALRLKPDDVMTIDLLKAQTYKDAAVSQKMAEKFNEAIKSLDEALRLKPTDVIEINKLKVQVYKSAAKAQIEAKEFNEAVQSLDNALRLKPANVTAINLLKAQAQKNAAETATAANHAKAKLHYEKACSYIGEFDWKNDYRENHWLSPNDYSNLPAIMLELNEVIRLVPNEKDRISMNCEDALYHRGIVHLIQGNSKQAVSDFTNPVDDGGRFKDHFPSQLRYSLLYINQFYYRGSGNIDLEEWAAACVDFDKAIKDINHLLDCIKKYIDAKVSAFDAAEASGSTHVRNPGEKLGISGFLVRYRGYPPSHQTIATSSWYKSNLELATAPARQHCETLHAFIMTAWQECHKKIEEQTQQRAALELQQRTKAEARQRAKEEAQLKKEHEQLEQLENLLQSGIGKRLAENYQGALADFEQLLSLTSDKKEVFYQRGLAKAGLGLHEEAIADYNHRLKNYAHLSNNDIAELLYVRGRAKEKLGLWDEAMQDYQGAMQQDSRHLLAEHALRNLKNKEGETARRAEVEQEQERRAEERRQLANSMQALTTLHKTSSVSFFASASASPVGSLPVLSVDHRKQIDEMKAKLRQEAAELGPQHNFKS